MQNWVPDDCLTSERASQPFALIVLDWAEQWFRRKPWLVQGQWRDLSRSEVSHYRTIERSSQVAIKGEDGAACHLALAILNMEGESPATDQDHELLTQLGRRALTDLAGRLLNLFKESPRGAAETQSYRGERPFQLSIGRPGSCPLLLEIGESDLRAFVRERFATTDLSAPLTASSEARNAVPVNISACLGTANVNLADLAELAIGDVIVLNTRAGEPATLLVEDTPTPIACSVIETSDECVLKLLEKH